MMVMMMMIRVQTTDQRRVYVKTVTRPNDAFTATTTTNDKRHPAKEKRVKSTFLSP